PGARAALRASRRSLQLHHYRAAPQLAAEGTCSMRIIDSHFHWWPRSVSERFCKRTTFPRAEVNGKGGYTYMRQKRADYELSSWAEWFDLDKQLEHMDGLGDQVDV